jgi:hypothetical protein
LLLLPGFFAENMMNRSRRSRWKSVRPTVLTRSRSSASSHHLYDRPEPLDDGSNCKVEATALIHAITSQAHGIGQPPAEVLHSGMQDDQSYPIKQPDVLISE